ncbi:MAG: DNA primase [Steroidobacteraceae bacterium]
MSGRIPQYFIDQLIARIDIVEVIGTRVPLRKAGKEYKACCPFHDEKTPSFNVVPDKQFYHCFGCGAHGTALGFLMEYDHLSFVEAIEELAARAGLEVPREEAVVSNVAKPSQDHYALLEQAGEYYRKQLRATPAAIEYLKKRGLSGETAARFGIGFVPDAWDGLIKQFGSSPNVLQDLTRVGLLIERDNKSGYYDRFRQRVMFPIRDSRGRTIGFGGRIIDQGEPKYLNSPETDLFHKGRELYGLYEARQSTRQLKQLMVVEGYMDVVSLHQAGITYAVATLGTATTPEHLKRLFRVCNTVVFCFDGDRAGRAAAWKALEVALPVVSEGYLLRFLLLPEKHDPDSLVQEEGREAFEARVSNATPLSTYLVQELAARFDLTHVDGRAQFTAEAQRLLSLLSDDNYRALLYQPLAEALNISVDRLRQLIPPAAPNATPARPAVAPPMENAGRGSLVRQIIQNLLHHPAAALVLDRLDEMAQIDKPGMPLLVQLANEIQEQPDLGSAALLERWRGRPDFNVIDKLFFKTTPVASLEIAKSEVKTAAQRLLTEQFPQDRFNELLHRFNIGILSPEEKQEFIELTRHRGGR